MNIAFKTCQFDTFLYASLKIFYTSLYWVGEEMKSIKELHKHDKPREKLVAKGVESLKNDELLAILLGSGVQGKDVRKLAKEIISLLD